MTASVRGDSRWLFGPLPDLLLGCGLLYAILFIASNIAGAELRRAQPALLFPIAVLLLSMPHYGATLVRVYEQRESRRAYALFSLWATLGVASLFVWGAHSTAVSAVMLTVYLTWSPWHYTGQNYGLAVMFLRRRGVPLEPRAKRLLHATFVLSYALTFVVMHARGGGSVDRPLAPAIVDFGFLPLGLPAALLAWLVPGLLLAYAASLAGAARLLLREARAIELLPTALLVLTQALWFSIPFAVRFLSADTGVDAIDWRHREHYLYWIVLGHAVQYLWVTAYYARRTPQWGGALRYGAKVLSAGVALWTLPVVLFAPSRLGELSYHTGLGLLLASAVNIHHFILDGAIWKLRSFRIARVLIRDEREPPEPTATDGARGRIWRGAVWGTAAAGLLVAGLVLYEEGVAYPRAMKRRDFAAAHASLDRLGWYGRGNFILRMQTPRPPFRDQAGEAASQRR